MWIVMGCVIAAGILGGGYYISVSALLGIILTGVLFYRMYIDKKVTAAWDLNMLAFAVLVFGYLAACLWAVDSGMALLGVVKFLPLLLFYVLVSGSEEERERMIGLLPMLGALMTLFSFLMMQFPVYEEWVSVAGRLAGFFQYPNTYALFMLICLVLVVWRMDDQKPDWLEVVYAGAAVFGIIMSGSRTVYILTAVTVVWFLAVKTPVRKAILPVVVLGLICTLVIAAVAGGLGILERFTEISLGASTFLGRLLYVRDAVPLIIHHPFGLGYYGYYFIQQSVQTGVYSVVNAHNELVQILLDVGVIPAAVMCAALVRSVCTKRTGMRNRMVLVLILLHSLMDYDFQFLAMGFVLILLLDMRNVRTQRVPVLTGAVTGAAGLGVAAIAVLGGLSDVCYTSGNYETALKLYSGNTLAQTMLLTEADTAEEMKETAEALISRNPYLAVAYSARARAAFSEGDVGAFIEDKQQAISLAPYQYEEYTDYLEILYYCENMYLQNGNTEDARICAERAAEIPELLDEVRERTSSLGWAIADRPQVTLSRESLEMIREMEEMADE